MMAATPLVSAHCRAVATEEQNGVVPVRHPGSRDYEYRIWGVDSSMPGACISFALQNGVHLDCKEKKNRPVERRPWGPEWAVSKTLFRRHPARQLCTEYGVHEACMLRVQYVHGLHIGVLMYYVKAVSCRAKWVVSVASCLSHALSFLSR